MVRPGPPSAGTAHRVRYVIRPPASADPAAPIVVAWHLLDAPCTEAAFAAALPLDGLDAWRVYLRLPDVRAEDARWSGIDVLLHAHTAVAVRARDELAPALVELRARYGLTSDAIGVVGGSLGGAVAALVMAEGPGPVRAAVLVNALLQLRPCVEALSRQHGLDFTWTAESDAVAGRLDFAARASDIAERGAPAVQLVVGADDLIEGFREPAARVAAALTTAHGDPSLVRLDLVEGMGHALAEQPGTQPAPQTQYAAEVDRIAVAWLTRHLVD